MAFSAPTKHDRKVPPAGQLDVNIFGAQRSVRRAPARSWSLAIFREACRSARRADPGTCGSTLLPDNDLGGEFRQIQTQRLKRAKIVMVQGHECRAAAGAAPELRGSPRRLSQAPYKVREPTCGSPGGSPYPSPARKRHSVGYEAPAEPPDILSLSEFRSFGCGSAAPRPLRETILFSRSHHQNPPLERRIWPVIQSASELARN